MTTVCPTLHLSVLRLPKTRRISHIRRDDFKAEYHVRRRAHSVRLCVIQQSCSAIFQGFVWCIVPPFGFKNDASRSNHHHHHHRIMCRVVEHTASGYTPDSIDRDRPSRAPRVRRGGGKLSKKRHSSRAKFQTNGSYVVLRRL